MTQWSQFVTQQSARNDRVATLKPPVLDGANPAEGVAHHLIVQLPEYISHLASRRIRTTLTEIAVSSNPLDLPEMQVSALAANVGRRAWREEGRWREHLSAG